MSTAPGVCAYLCTISPLSRQKHRSLRLSADRAMCADICSTGKQLDPELDGVKKKFDLLRFWFLPRPSTLLHVLSITCPKHYDSGFWCVRTLMEGLEFHPQFLSEQQCFEKFAETAKKSALGVLRNGLI